MKPFWKKPEELEKQINEYFTFCENTGQMPGYCALAVHLDIDRQTLLNYKWEDEKILALIKKAKARVEAAYEQHLNTGKGSAAGLIFSLKNNYNWRDKVETDITTKGEKISGFNYIVPEKKDE